jgi:hypothetical protein
MLSIEALIQRIIFFVKRYVYTFATMLTTPTAIMRAILSGSIKESIDSDTAERKYTNPHVFFILGLLLVCAQLDTLLDLHNTSTPLGFWDIPSERLLHLLSTNLFNQSFYDTALHTVPLALMYYILFYGLSFAFFRHKQSYRLMLFSFLYWMGTMLITFFILYFLVPSFLFHTLGTSYNVVNGILKYINIVHTLFYLTIPILSVRSILISDLDFAPFLILSFIVSFSIWFFGVFYMFIERATEKPSVKKIYFLSKPLML